jgi:hypothetical protein
MLQLFWHHKTISSRQLAFLGQPDDLYKLHKSLSVTVWSTFVEVAEAPEYYREYISRRLSRSM